LPCSDEDGGSDEDDVVPAVPFLPAVPPVPVVPVPVVPVLAVPVPAVPVPVPAAPVPAVAVAGRAPGAFYGAARPAAPAAHRHGAARPAGPAARGRGAARPAAPVARGRGAARPAAPAAHGVGRRNAAAPMAFQTYTAPDVGNHLPPFTPNRLPGIHFGRPHLRNTMTTALEFFHLYFTPEMISNICSHTNSYANEHIIAGANQSYTKSDGSWQYTTPDEINRLIALLIYKGFVKVSYIEKYWSTKSLYNGLWASAILSRTRFKALMVKSRHRSGIRQYIKA